MSKKKFKSGDVTNKGIFLSYGMDGQTCSVEENLSNGKTRIHIVNEREVEILSTQKKVEKGYEDVYIKPNPNDKL